MASVRPASSERAFCISLCLFFLCIVAFVCGIGAEFRKLAEPFAGTPIQVKDGVICTFPIKAYDTFFFGCISICAFFIIAVIGQVTVFCPYGGKHVPLAGLFRSTSLLVLFIIAELVTATALTAMLWATIQEGQLLRTHKVHHDMSYACPTYLKTGLFTGAAYLEIGAVALWQLCQMRIMHARAVYVDDKDEEEEVNPMTEFILIYILWVAAVAAVFHLIFFTSHRAITGLLTAAIISLNVFLTWRWCKNAIARRKRTAAGRSTSKVAALPTFRYARDDGGQCTICISVMRTGDIARQLPHCGHTFHAGCINSWLADHLTCPICRAEAVSSSATPGNVAIIIDPPVAS